MSEALRNDPVGREGLQMILVVSGGLIGCVELTNHRWKLDDGVEKF
jgi:hypothetical protein